ncbi:MAG: hypothetical protein U0531_20850, partial [Dehalococcoidia bacterium]
MEEQGVFLGAQAGRVRRPSCYAYDSAGWTIAEAVGSWVTVNGRPRCTDPNAVADGDLIAVARAEAEPSVLEHLHACRACQDRAANYRALERRLEQALFRLSCPSSETLGEYALDLLPPDERVALAGHLVD